MPVMFHNALMMLREAAGDITGAIVELHEMTRAAAAGDWGAAAKRSFALKDSWHRAYLYRIAAESARGGQRRALLQYAESARQEYRRAVHGDGDYADSIAVLDAYFAVRDGDAAAALEAARRVDVEENGDVEDLYLTAIALEFGGDERAAAAVRDKILHSENVYLAPPLIRSWLEYEADREHRPVRWTPRYPIAE